MSENFSLETSERQRDFTRPLVLPSPSSMLRIGVFRPLTLFLLVLDFALLVISKAFTSSSRISLLCESVYHPSVSNFCDVFCLAARIGEICETSATSWSLIVSVCGMNSLMFVTFAGDIDLRMML